MFGKPKFFEHFLPFPITTFFIPSFECQISWLCIMLSNKFGIAELLDADMVAIMLFLFFIRFPLCEEFRMDNIIPDPEAIALVYASWASSSPSPSEKRTSMSRFGPIRLKLGNIDRDVRRPLSPCSRLAFDELLLADGVAVVRLVDVFFVFLLTFRFFRLLVIFTFFVAIGNLLSEFKSYSTTTVRVRRLYFLRRFFRTTLGFKVDEARDVDAVILRDVDGCGRIILAVA
jgi:hypothetical protein